MSVDYRPRRKKPNWPLILALVAVGGAAAIAGELWWLKADAARKEAARVVGPPCPTITPEVFAARYGKARNVDVYEGVGVDRGAGHMSCDLEDGKVPVCSLTAPIAVVVTPPGKAPVYFEPGVGRPATVAVRDGVATCIVGANFDD